MYQLVKGSLAVQIVEICSNLVPANEQLASGLGRRLAYHVYPDRMERFVGELTEIKLEQLEASDRLQMHHLVTGLGASGRCLVLTEGNGIEVLGLTEDGPILEDLIELCGQLNLTQRMIYDRARELKRTADPYQSSAA